MPVKHYRDINDASCGWTHTATVKTPEFPLLEHDAEADWVIVGAGFTGLAAAYRIAELRPDDSVILLDAELPGNGASARNSGYIVDITLNDGGSSLADERTQMIKSRLNLSGLALLESRVEEFAIACDWDRSGKFHCAADTRHIPKLRKFEAFLERAGVPYETWHKEALAERLGTEYYQYAVQTTQGVLVNPAALINGLLQNLPASVRVYQRSPVLDILPGQPARLRTASGEIQAGRVIVATNALMPRLGIKRARVFPLVLTASLSRPLSEAEYDQVGRPDPWGVLSASSFGATVRLTNDRRILVRNTVEWWPQLAMGQQALAERRKKNLAGLRRRFPGLTGLEFEYSWSGAVCISRNSKPVFEKTRDSLFLAGCYNAGGVAMGSLFGKLIVDHALGIDSEELELVLATEKPTRLPPRPLLGLGVKTRLAWQRYQGRNEA